MCLCLYSYALRKRWKWLGRFGKTVVGRYLYAQIPRSISPAELTLKQIDALRQSVQQELANQRVFPPGRLERLVHTASRAQVQAMSIASVLWTMLRLDLSRPFLAAALRRERMSGAEVIYGGQAVIPDL